MSEKVELPNREVDRVMQRRERQYEGMPDSWKKDNPRDWAEEARATIEYAIELRNERDDARAELADAVRRAKQAERELAEARAEAKAARESALEEAAQYAETHSAPHHPYDKVYTYQCRQTSLAAVADRIRALAQPADAQKENENA